MFHIIFGRNATLDPHIPTHKLNFCDLKPVKQAQTKFHPKIMGENEKGCCFHQRGAISRAVGKYFAGNQNNGQIQICIDFHNLNNVS